MARVILETVRGVTAAADSKFEAYLAERGIAARNLGTVGPVGEYPEIEYVAERAVLERMIDDCFGDSADPDYAIEDRPDRVVLNGVEHEVYYTTAPQAYDYSYVTVLKDAAETDVFDGGGRPLREVAIPPDRSDYQRGRYGSGLHAAITPTRTRELGYLKAAA